MKKTLSLLLFVSMLATATAQISVTVDGRPVAFTGTGPQRVNGRVLVPLRGVLEAMGAFVEFRSGVVSAQKGNTQIEMRLGQQVAMVNGRDVALEVPAMSVGGRTMVPLRFVGEALGADVRWDAATQAVAILTGGGGGDIGDVQITGMDVRYTSEWMKPGDVLEVVLGGTPGGVASFRIPGLVDRVSMREESAGVYRGSWTIPRTANLSGARVLGELSLGGVQRLIQGGGALNVDSTPPKITNVIPEDRSRVPANRLSVSAVFEDASGSGVSASDVTMRVDGDDVTSEATVTGSFITWRPETSLRAGRHTAAVTAVDKAGNSVSKNWEFTISDATSAIQSFSHDNTTRVEPGDEITATLRGERNATVSFAIGTRRDIPMRETQDGVYVGEYVVRRGDNFSNAAVVATMKTTAGETFTVEAERRINATAGSGDAPRITSHREGDEVGASIVLRGTTAPNAKVLVKVDYATTVIGGIRVGGRLYEQEVQANSQGVWVTESIDVRPLVSGDDTTYKVTASLVVAEGDRAPEPAVVNLKKR